MASVSVLAFFVVVCLEVTAAVVNFPNRTCTIKRYGKLTVFNGETYNVEIPCKYRLAHIECGGYVLKVTPGGVVDGKRDNRFSVDTLWIGIIQKSTTSEKRIWKGRTSSNRLEEAHSIADVWTSKVVNLTLDYEAYETEYQAAVLEMFDTFRITFSKGRRDDGVYVTCMAHDFRSVPYPKSLCGIGSQKNAIGKRRKVLFGQDQAVNNTKANLLIHDLLNDSRIDQSKTCAVIAEKFRACSDQDKVTAARVCGSIFSVIPLARCFVTEENVSGSFELCLDAVCKKKACACRKLRNMAMNCEFQNVTDNFDNLVCPQEKPIENIP